MTLVGGLVYGATRQTKVALVGSFSTCPRKKKTKSLEKPNVIMNELSDPMLSLYIFLSLSFFSSYDNKHYLPDIYYFLGVSDLEFREVPMRSRYCRV